MLKCVQLYFKNIYTFSCQHFRNLEGATQRTEIPQMAAERFALSPLEIVPKENVQKEQTAQHHHISSRYSI